MLATLREFGGSRWRLVAVFAGLAIVRACASGPLPKATVEGLTGALAKATQVSVDESGLSWEPSGGPIADLVLGRRVLFVGEAPGQPRDVFRASVRVTPEGQVLRPSRWTNLTQTTLADETGLLAVGERATYTTMAQDEVSAVTLLELGRGALAAGGWTDLFDEPHSLSQLRRVHFAVGGERVEVSLDETGLALGVGTNSPIRYSFETGEFDGAAAEAPEHWVQPSTSSNDSGFADRVLTVVGVKPSQRPEVGPSQQRRAPRRVEAGLSARAKGVSLTWPPAQLPAAAQGPTPDAWRALGTAPPDEPPLFYESSLQLADSRTAAVVVLDLRRLQLLFDGGFERPAPPFGPPGKGRVNPTLIPRLVATFNGVGTTDGAMADGRLLQSPQSAQASLVMTAAGGLGFGRWPRDESLPSGIVSFRQSGDPLVEAGEAVARDARTGARSALCRRKDGHVLYAWSNDASWRGLAEALARAECEFAVRLGEGERASGFGVVSNSDALQLSPLRDDMRPPDPESSADDYFYLVSRDAMPDDEGIDWRPSLGAQPEPGYLPALLAGRTRVGNLDLELFAVRPGRVQWKVVGGTAEPLLEGRPAPRRELEADDNQRVLFALDVGHTTRSTRYGLSFGKRQTLALRSVYPTLALARDGDVELLPAGAMLEPTDHADYLQLPALVTEGALTPRASQTGARRLRGALCVSETGRVLVAFVEHDTSAPLAIYLLGAGCDVAFELDRASQHRAMLYRTGTSLSPPAEAETTRLVGLERPMVANTFTFGP